MRAQPARAALETALRRDAYARSSGAGPRPVTEHFSAVDDAMSQLEETILSSIRGSVFAGEEGCRTLVRALRVVEEQETLSLLSTKAREQRSRFFGDDSSGTILGKGFKRRALREVRKAISEKITEALKELHPPAGEVGETSFFDDVPETLRNLEILMRVLTEAYDYAVPAFPPKYRVFESVIAPSWHRHVRGGGQEVVARNVSICRTRISSESLTGIRGTQNKWKRLAWWWRPRQVNYLRRHPRLRLRYR